MSQGKGGSNTATTVNGGEGEGGVAVSPTVNEDKAGVAVPPLVIEGEDKAVTPPIADNGQEIDDISLVLSYEPGNDYLEPVISDGEVKYEGKGKGRTESFSHLPAPGQSVSSTAPKARPTSQAQADSAPSTAPSTRPASQVQDDSAPSTAPTTRPSSQVQADPESSLAGGTASVQKGKGGSAAITAQGDSEPLAGQGESAATPIHDVSGPITGQDHTTAMATQDDSAPASGQSDSAATVAQDESPHHIAQTGPGPNATQDDTPTKNCFVRHDCGCTDIYDDTGKKRQQACDHHRFNPNRSILPLPPKKPLSESTNLHGCTRDLLVHTPQARRNEGSPPRQPPVVIPTKGRNFVQGSENGPTFLDSFNSERAIEPTGPPNTLTTIPTQKDVPLKKKSTGRVSNPKVSIPKASGPKASGPKAPDPVTAENTPNPPQVHEDASGPQAKQPQKSDAMEGHETESSASEDEQRTVSIPASSSLVQAKAEQDEEATTEPRHGESKEDTDDRGSPLDDEHHQIFTGRARREPVAAVCSPAHRKDIAPKSILKKPVGTTAEATPAEGDDAPSGQFSTDYGSEITDHSGGVKLFQETLAKLKGGEGNSRATHAAGGPVRETQGGVPIPRIVLNTDAGPVGATTNGNGEPVFVAAPRSRDSDGESSDGNGHKFLSKCCFS